MPYMYIMLAKPPKKEPPLLATQKKDYGKVPKYLHTIKSQIAAEKEMIAEFQRQQEEAATQSIRPMSEDERDELLYDMKVKWGKLNEAYGKLSFTLDVPSTTSLISRFYSVVIIGLIVLSCITFLVVSIVRA